MKRPCRSGLCVVFISYDSKMNEGVLIHLPRAWAQVTYGCGSSASKAGLILSVVITVINKHKHEKYLLQVPSSTVAMRECNWYGGAVNVSGAALMIMMIQSSGQFDTASAKCVLIMAAINRSGSE